MPNPNTRLTKPPDVSDAAKVDGWMTQRELEWLATRAADKQIIVEVGSYMGRSTLVLAQHCPGVVYAIDKWGEYRIKWKNGKVWPAFQANLAAHITSGKVVPIRAKTPAAWHALDQLLGGRKADMIFIDGDHRYSAVASDCIEAWKRLAPTGLLCGHDYGAPALPEVKQAVDVTCGPLVQVAVDTIFEIVPMTSYAR